MTARSRAEAALARLETADRDEAWISLRPAEDVLADADAVDARVAAGERLALAGVIVGVKDNIDVLGLETTAGARSYAYSPTRDSTAVARLRAEGAIVLGKTNLDQFATGLVGTRSPFGATRNAWSAEHISGGSSAGSAVVVALGIADIALGTDTAGSGRVPAALNGIWGFKPTRGRIPTTGVVPACRSIDVVTVFARDARLGRLAVSVMTGPDGVDPLARPMAVPTAAPARRVAVPPAEELGDLAEGWAEAFGAVVAQLGDSGIEVVERSIQPLLAAAALLYGGALVAERYAAVGAHIAAHPELVGTDLDPTVSAIILAGAAPSAVDLFRDLEQLDGYRMFAALLLADVDAILTPTTTWHPTLEQVAADPVGANSRMGRFTNYANLLDLAAVAAPAGSVGGLPFGVMLTGAAFDDERLADLAALVGGATREIFVVGAHLTGQPLNPQLVSAGGSLVGAASTSADYRLYRLDTQPAKPGLVRSRDGSSIEGEVWRLPVAGFGAFVAALPRPMAIGSVELADGRAVSGFLCEPEAVESALDITDRGSWRAWLSEDSARGGTA